MTRPIVFLLAAIGLLTTPAFAQTTPVSPPDDNSPVDSQPMPASAQPAPQGSQDMNIAARDPRTLAPLLIPTDVALRNGLSSGRTFAKTPKDLIDLMAGGRRVFATRRGGMFGEKDRNTGVAIWITPMLEAQWRGFLEQRNYADDAARQADFDTMRQEVTASRRTLTFLIEFSDLFPDVKKNKDKDSATLMDPKVALAHVDGTHFILSDDHDNNYQPLPSPTLAPSILPRQQFYDQIGGDPTRLFGAPGSGAYGDSRRYVKAREAYSELGAFYVVSFDAFNQDGTARINRDTKYVTLRILGPNGDKSVQFPLDKIP